MGSSTSRPRSQAPRTRSKRVVASVSKRSLSSFICGGSSTSRAASEPEDYPAETLVNSAECHDPVVSKIQGPKEESTLSSDGGTGLPNSETERGVSFRSSDPSTEEYFKHHFGTTDSSSDRKSISEINEVAASHAANDGGNYYPPTDDDEASTSLSGPSVDMNSNLAATDVGEYHLPQTTDVDLSLINRLNEEEGSIQSLWGAFDGHFNGLRSLPASHLVPSPPLLSFGTGSPSIEDNNMPSRSADLVSNSGQDLREGDTLHVNMVSISSGGLSDGNEDTTAPEAGRHGRRMFWDSFSNHSSRRRSDFSTILLATEDTNSVGSRRRWLIDFGGDLDHGNGGASHHLDRRNHVDGERWWRTRSQLLDRMRGGSGQGVTQTCPLGLHPDGSCSCGLDEDTSTRASISRIVMLAEALFEVLDEIHRHPSSVSFSMVSHPAPQSVVDAFPLRTYKKSSAVEIEVDVEQCHICLAEYEDDDKIRTLPCHHEYHMSCVDKWLKEIHGVCPLCRGNVCESSGLVANLDDSPLQLDHHA